MKLRDLQVTREQFRGMLATARARSDHRLMEKSILALYALQTADERQDAHTKRGNNRGFSKVTDAKGSYIARWLLRGNRVSGKYIEFGYRISHEHAGQLARIANKEEPYYPIVSKQMKVWNNKIHPALVKRN